MLRSLENEEGPEVVRVRFQSGGNIRGSVLHVLVMDGPLGIHIFEKRPELKWSLPYGHFRDRHFEQIPHAAAALPLCAISSPSLLTLSFS